MVVWNMSRRSAISHLLDPSWSMHQVLGILTLRATSTVQRRVARFVKGNYDRTISVTSMLADLKWNMLQERRLQSKTVMFYKIVHQLVPFRTAPYLIPARSSRGRNMRFLLPQSTSECSPLLILPQHHEDLEPAAPRSRLST